MMMRIRPVRSMRGSCCIDCAVFPLHPTTSGCALQQSVPKPETQQTLCGWRLLEPCFRQRNKKLASVVRVMWSSYPSPFWSVCVFPSPPLPFLDPPSFTRGLASSVAIFVSFVVPLSPTAGSNCAEHSDHHRRHVDSRHWLYWS